MVKGLVFLSEEIQKKRKEGDWIYGRRGH